MSSVTPVRSRSDPWETGFGVQVLWQILPGNSDFFLSILLIIQTLPAITCNENALLYWRGVKRGVERKGPGKGKDRENRDYWNNPGAELLRSCMSGKGRSAPQGPLITYLKNVNRIPGQTPLTPRNQGESRPLSVHYSARKYVPTRPKFDSSLGIVSKSRGPANQQGSFAVIH